MSAELDGQVAVVTGAGTGIGVGIARHLAEAGASLIVSAYSSFEGADDLAKALNQAGHKARAVKCDFRKAANASDVVKAALDAYGGLDILVNNAGFTLDKAFVECSEKDWDDLFNINIKSMFVTCAAAVPHMIARKYGRIINISSVHSVQHIPGYVLYGATKGAINEFTRALAVELGPHGITANVIAPGAIYVPRYDATGVDKDGMIRRIPARALGDADDIGRAAAFLSSPKADYISGEVLFIDGAVTARMAVG